MISKPVATLIIVMFSSITFAQTNPITLEQAITIAKNNNAGLKIADKEIEKQTVLKKAAFQPDPLQIQYMGGQYNSKDFDNNISMQQYFPIGGITKANRQLQEELAKLAAKAKALSEYDLEKAVTLSYYQYLYGINVQKLNSELYEIYSKFLKNAELRYATGESGKIETISAKARVKEIETQKAQLEYELAVYQKQFQYFLQTTEAVTPDAKTLLQYEFLETADNSKVQGLLSGYFQQQIAVLEKQTKIFNKLRVPRVGMGYFIQSLNKETYFQGLTAGLQIPLFGNVNVSRAKAAEISQSQAQLDFERSKLELDIRQQELRNDFEKHKKGVEYYKTEGIQYAEQIIATAQKSYANGDMSYWIYISFLNQAIDIKKQYVEAVNMYNQSAIHFRFPTVFNN